MLHAVNLRTEYLKNPLGIDAEHPCFGWTLEGDGKEQRAFEIRCAHSVEELEQANFCWESGTVESRSMMHHPYGEKLQSRERVYWQVRITDETGVAGEWSDPEWFEMGLLRSEDWSAYWITGDYEPEKGVHYPSDLFRRRFDAGEVKQARMYITACGVYQTCLNGKRVGDQVLTPGTTSYDKRIQYQVYDITELLKDGENTWDIALGDGWFRGNLGVMEDNYVYGDRTAVLAQIEWTDGQGETHRIVTDTDFAWCNDEPVWYTDIKGGERIDARKVPTYQGKAKKTVWEAKLSCSGNVPVLEHERFHPAVLHTPNGETVLDFGQNIAGYVEFSIEGEAGREVTMTMGEKLDEDGNFTLDNILQRITFQEDPRDFSYFQKVVYCCSGNGRETWKPKFCFQGFRYARIENWPEGFSPEDFTAIAVYSDMDICSSFSSSSSDLDQIVENTLWSMKGNFLDVPTDCPTRERAGWTGDAQLFFNAGCYFMDFSAFFRKWLRDLYDDQAENGMIYNIVPRCGMHGGQNAHVEGSAGWTDAGILIPYRYWNHYFDRDLLESRYEGMKRLMDFLLSRRGVPGDPNLDQKLPPSEYRKYMITGGFHFGEWTEPDVDVVQALSDTYEEATAYLIYTLRHMAVISEMLGKTEEAEQYRVMADESEEAYCYYYVKDGHIPSDRMCKYVRPLALGLLEKRPEIKKLVQEDLIRLVRERDYKVGTGFLSTPFLLNVLTDAGYAEDAYKMILKEAYPGWVYEIRQGATTVWENWGDDASLNHYSKGAVCDWIFNTVCGVTISGENEFRIAPVPGTPLSYAKLEYRSPFGCVKSGWRRTAGGIRYQFEIPAGCSAEIVLPDENGRIVQAGIWTFTRRMLK